MEGGAVTSLNSANTGASTGGGSNLVAGSNAAANLSMQGDNALASGIGSGINNAIAPYYLNQGGGVGANNVPRGLVDCGAAQNPFGIGLGGGQSSY